MRREKSLRIDVHHADAVVWGPVYTVERAFIAAASYALAALSFSEKFPKNTVSALAGSTRFASHRVVHSGRMTPR
jgi:hypothetical protein